jgi:hypothetical protein
VRVEREERDAGSTKERLLIWIRGGQSLKTSWQM